MYRHIYNFVYDLYCPCTSGHWATPLWISTVAMWLLWPYRCSWASVEPCELVSLVVPILIERREKEGKAFLALASLPR